MRYQRPARVAAVAVLAALGTGVLASVSGADDAGEAVYGTLETIDPLVGFDWAPPVEDAAVAQAAANGATVTGRRARSAIGRERRRRRSSGVRSVQPVISS